MILKLHENSSNLKIVFFPYAAGFASQFRDYLPILNPNYDVYAVEYPGRGNTLSKIKPTFHELSLEISKELSIFKKNQLILFGISMGGYLAFKIAQILKLYLAYPIHKLILVSVSNETQLKSMLNLAQTSDYFEELLNTPDSSMLPFLYELLEHDQEILRTMNLDLCTLSNIPVTLFNSESDILCHSEETQLFWKSRIFDTFSYKIYQGKHIPAIDDIANILQLTELTL